MPNHSATSLPGCENLQRRSRPELRPAADGLGMRLMEWRARIIAATLTADRAADACLCVQVTAAPSRTPRFAAERVQVVPPSA